MKKSLVKLPVKRFYPAWVFKKSLLNLAAGGEPLLYAGVSLLPLQSTDVKNNI
ncbi:hypothetical protein [Bacillus sp. FJAT-42376]|uniref:hypothetical protein n=1 Tax=Bacillus sp. FJAT-42376 TaxID=2014076 RepID=UPI0013DD95D9|nr:hypothetical protein [Bacillus sp. FJAT-42376]